MGYPKLSMTITIVNTGRAHWPGWRVRGFQSRPPDACVSCAGSARRSGHGRSRRIPPAASSPWQNRLRVKHVWAGHSSVGRAFNQKARRNTEFDSPAWLGTFLAGSTIGADSPTVFVQPRCTIACTKTCERIQNNLKQWQPYHCLDAQRYGTHR